MDHAHEDKFKSLDVDTQRCRAVTSLNKFMIKRVRPGCCLALEE